MEHKTENNCLAEKKKRKRKNCNISKNQNKVTQKFTGDQNDKLLYMAKSNFDDLCTSSNQNIVFSKSNTSTLHVDIVQNGKQFNTKNVSCSDLNQSEVVKPIDSSHMDIITTFDTDKCLNKHSDDKLSSTLEINIDYKNILKRPGMIQFVGCEDNRFVHCRYCHSMICFDVQLLSKHSKKCKQCIETKLNYIKQFNCLVCDITVNCLTDWKTHAISTSHLDKCMNINDYVSYDCGSCKAVYFGSKEKILYHCKTMHKNRSGLSCVFKLMQEVFHDFMSDSQKRWTFCSLCKEYSRILNIQSSQFNCLNHENKKTNHFKCNTCSIDFICSQVVYIQHLISCEHFMLEHLRSKIKVTPDFQRVCNLKLPQIFLNKFNIDHEKTTCNDCELQIVPDEKAITVHLTSCIFKSDLGGKNTLNIKNYFCKLCDEIISDFSQWKYHLISPNHLIKCHNFIDLVSYTCETCSLHCYGNAHYATDHQKIHPNNSEYNLSKFIAFNYKRINNELKSKDYYYCEVCETYAEVNSSDHWNKSHFKKLKRLACLPCRTEFFCIEENNLFERHTLSNEHILLKYVFTKKESVESKPNILENSKKLNEVNDKNKKPRDVSKVLENSLPFIIKPYSNWFIENKNKAVCISCDEILDTNENVLLSHLLVCKQNSTNNMLRMSLNYLKCLECSFYSNVYESWKTHVLSHVILDLYDKYSYFCKTCNSLLYGKMSSIEVHLNNEHSTVFSEMPLETALLAKQLTRRHNNPCKSPDIMCVCEPCNKIFKVLENPNHFNTDRHLSVASDTVELFYCKYCLVEFYSPNSSIELHKYTVEHIILSSKYSVLKVKDFPKQLKLDTHLLKFITDQTLYEHTQNIGFFCFICDYICLNLIAWKTHINGKKHSHSSKRFPCIDHRCKICKTLMFGQRQHIFEHYNNRFHSMLRQCKKMTLSEEKKTILFQEESENNLISKTQTISENNQMTENEKNTIEKSLTSNEIHSFKKMLDKLSIQSNDPHDCSVLGKPASDIGRSATKTIDESHFGLNTNQDNNLVDKSCTNVIEKYPLKNNADKISIKSNTKNFVNFYELKIKILKESLVINNDQLVYYCLPCDFITAVKLSWDNHNKTQHWNDIQLRRVVFCDICNLYQVGPSDNLDKHFTTIEHKIMEDLLKSSKLNITKNVNYTTKERNEKKSNLFSDKALNVTTALVPDKQEKTNNINDEKEVSNRNILIEIKGIKAEYKNNGWTELKKIIVTYGLFGLLPKNNNVIIKFRKRVSALLMMKDKEKLEKNHDFTITVLDEEEKLPELQRITEYEFGNKETLTKIINSQLLDIKKEISNSDIDQKLINLISSIHICAGQYFLNGKIYAFGSRMSGLALKDSDVDLYFDIANTFYGSLSNDLCAQEDLVRYFGKVFRSQNKEFKQVQSITGARVPIVKFFHYPSGLNCDLSFKSGLSTHNTKLIRLYLTLDERVHWVVCAVVKRWALQNNIKNQTMFSSYALAWLVLFYLMTVKVVPSLKFLRDNAVYSKNATNAISDEMFIEDWDCTFCTLEKAKQIWNVPESSCWDLLVNFFNFYSNPNSLKKFVFCPAIGEAVPKEQFIQIPLKNPDKLGFNKKKIGNPSQWSTKLRNNFSGEGLAVQDPFDLFHNITKIITPRKLRAFSHLCSKTLEIMNRPYYA